MDESAIRISMIEQRRSIRCRGDLYAEDVIWDFPQSGERIRGLANLIAQRRAERGHPSISKVLRIMGSGPVWVSEVIITYDGKPWYTVKAFDEFRGDKDSTKLSTSGNQLLPRRGARNGSSQ